MTYKPLPKEVRKKGMYYKLVERDENFAIYSIGNSVSAFLGYEIFEVPRHDGFEIKGNKIPPTEYMPSDESFGVTAFHTNTLERAKLRLQQLRDLKRLRDQESKVSKDKKCNKQ